MLASREQRNDLLRRIFKYVVKGESPDSCWQWIGPDSGNGRGGGYGRVSFQGRTQAVHILVYELLVGKRRRGRQIDHTCNNRRCCNPKHLEQVTHMENQKRRDIRTKSIGET